MKKTLAVLFVLSSLHTLASEPKKIAQVHCYDDKYRDFDLDFWYNYSIKFVSGKHVLIVTKSKYEENTKPEILSKTMVKKIVGPTKTIYRNLDNTESLTVTKDDMGTGVSKKADLAATNMQCMRNVEVEF